MGLGKGRQMLENLRPGGGSSDLAGREKLRMSQGCGHPASCTLR